jgi:two-component system OmpR family sensor kinase
MLETIEHSFNEQVASENRLRQFLADASHELRTPVTSIRGYAELFRRAPRSDPMTSRPRCERIEDESIRMGTLVDDLLLLARLDQGRPLEMAPSRSRA